MRSGNWRRSTPCPWICATWMPVNLFAPDIRVSREKVGRSHLKRWLDDTLRLQFTGTSHHIGNHIIEFDDPDHAHGVVYSKNEHETGDEWVIMQMLYWDNYQRIDGRWYFRRRLPCYWYATDSTSRRWATTRCAGRTGRPTRAPIMSCSLLGGVLGQPAHGGRAGRGGAGPWKSSSIPCAEAPRNPEYGCADSAMSGELNRKR